MIRNVYRNDVEADMISTVAQAVGLKYEPMALLFSEEKPEGARQFKEGKWGCVMFMVAAVLRGETAVFDRTSFGCFGGGVGLGFGDQYENFPGGKGCFTYFLSVGNDQWQRGRETAEQVKPFMRAEAFHHFMHGERYLKSPELVLDFINQLPITEIPAPYLVLKPLSGLSSEEIPHVVIFFGNMDQVSALTVLVNYGRGHNENVIFPYAAGCQTLGIYPLAEAKREQPRAVLGLNDLSARVYLKRLVKEDLFSFAVPRQLFDEMEGNVAGSFLEGETWQELRRLGSF
ncbi:hypothetical protein DPPLL_18420 [Desulfofustis limnaeus]|uniref:DUF169 domain-containing protein n=2 Tax=Desulfofustis limnaeus TaxID=2740163 RepID=A0ABM7W969_9BACT|nr:hypothetical protein DPPLL_18420 [Desulfofustis limnaeus]